MSSPPASGESLLIARLEARVEVLEEALRSRSRQWRAVQDTACRRDLAVIARVAAGLPPLPSGPFDSELWVETTALAPADVATTLRELWRSQSPRR